MANQSEEVPEFWRTGGRHSVTALWAPTTWKPPALPEVQALQGGVTSYRLPTPGPMIKTSQTPK